MNLNDLAKKITEKEGGKRNLNIADVKETLKCLGEIMRVLSTAECIALMNKLISKK